MRFISAILALLFSGPTTITTYAQPADIVIIDVRTPGEFASNHIKGAINIDFYASDFKEKISKLDTSKDYKVYCRSGNRSGQSVNLMKSLGFKNVENIGGLGQAARKLNAACEQGPC